MKAPLLPLRQLAAEAPLLVRVRGGCMAPDLPDGARVEVAPSRFYRPGDLIAFLSPSGDLTVHRALGYRLRGWRLALVTQADLGAAPDSPVDPARILGRVQAIVTAADERRPFAPRRLLALARFVRYLAAGSGRRLRRWGGTLRSGVPAPP